MLPDALASFVGLGNSGANGPSSSSLSSSVSRSKAAPFDPSWWWSLSESAGFFVGAAQEGEAGGGGGGGGGGGSFDDEFAPSSAPLLRGGAAGAATFSSRAAAQRLRQMVGVGRVVGGRHGRRPVDGAADRSAADEVNVALLADKANISVIRILEAPDGDEDNEDEGSNHNYGINDRNDPTDQLGSGAPSTLTPCSAGPGRTCPAPS